MAGFLCQLFAGTKRRRLERTVRRDDTAPKHLVEEATKARSAPKEPSGHGTCDAAHRPHEALRRAARSPGTKLANNAAPRRCPQRTSSGDPSPPESPGRLAVLSEAA